MSMYVRDPLLTLTALLVITMVALVAQQPISAKAQHEHDNFGSAGPFLFGSGTTQPTYMDPFDARPIVKSPDGKLEVTVTGAKESYRAWVTILPFGSAGVPVEVWPIQRNVAVLWKPDSRAFALTDNRYANLSYVLVCSDILICRAEFSAADEEPKPGIAMNDLTPVVRKAFEEHVRKYYKTEDLDTPLFYAKVLRWTAGHHLLVGVSARTLGPVTFPNHGQREWDFAYVVDVPNKRVVREVDRNQLRSEYKIEVPY